MLSFCINQSIPGKICGDVVVLIYKIFILHLVLPNQNINYNIGIYISIAIFFIIAISCEIYAFIKLKKFSHQ